MTRSLLSSRNTRQKRAIVEFLSANRGAHLTAEGLCEELRKSGTPVGQATVYRVLKSLEAKGDVKRHFVADGSGACYQYVGDQPECNEHYHLVCDSCGSVTHIESELLEGFVHEMRRKKQFIIDRRRMSFYGRCDACREENADG